MLKSGDFCAQMVDFHRPSHFLLDMRMYIIEYTWLYHLLFACMMIMIDMYVATIQNLQLLNCFTYLNGVINGSIINRFSH